MCEKDVGLVALAAFPPTSSSAKNVKACHRTALLAVLRPQNREIPKQLEPHFEHVGAVVIVFDVEQEEAAS
jgi:hypothetical protein